jgi:phage recombination protein Bet
MSENAVISRVNYEVNGEKLEITANTVKQYLVAGQANKITTQEVGMFLKLCQGQKLNPFLREAYLVKYGEQPAQMVVGKDAFTKRAENNPNYKGSKAGIIVVNLKGDIEEREGTFYLHSKNREELVGGWAKVFFKDGKEEVYHTVSLDEYNTGKSMWANKPATMIRKVALVQALREAFPNSLSQLYTQEEVGVDEDLPNEPIDIDKERMKAEEVEPVQKPANKKQKAVLMNVAKEKGFADGKDVSKLEEFAKANGYSLRNLTEAECESLIKLVAEYEEPRQEEIIDADFTPVEDEHSEEVNELEEENESDPF